MFNKINQLMNKIRTIKSNTEIVNVLSQIKLECDRLIKEVSKKL